MNPEQQRIAIAEACGWKNADHPDVMKFKQGWTTPEQWCMNPKGVLRLNHDRPDYLNDLNAMHEAEASLFGRNDWSASKYETLLTRMTSSWAWHATAAQRAEAFLRTIGKWEEGK